MFIPRAASILLLIIGTAACSSDSSNDSPTAPGSPTAPSTTSTTASRVITLNPQTPSPVGKAIAIFVATDPAGHRAGMISLAITAHNLSDVYGLRAGLRWDESIFETDGIGPGGFMTQGGTQVTCCLSTLSTAVESAQVLAVDRPTSGAPVSGSGEMILVRLRPRDGAPAGTYPLTFQALSFQPGAFVTGDGPGKNQKWPQDNLYTATLTLQ